jgi:hypothetical protein
VASNDRMIIGWWIGKDVEGWGRGLILRYYPSSCLDTLTNTARNLRIAGFRPIFELWTSRIRSRSINHSTATFGSCFVKCHVFFEICRELTGWRVQYFVRWYLNMKYINVIKLCLFYSLREIRISDVRNEIRTLKSWQVTQSIIHSFSFRSQLGK